MRDGWVETTLGEVSALQMGRTPSRRENSYWTDDLTYPFCTIADMDAKYVEPKREGVTKAAIMDGKAKMATKGTLLMSFKLTIGRMGFAARNIFPNEAIVMIEADESKVLNEFLYLRLASMDLTEGSGRAVKGSTLNSASIASIAFLVPPLPEQKRIVDLISSLDSYIDSLQQHLESAKKSRNAVLHELLIAGGDGWVETSLEDVAEVIMGQSPDGKSYNQSGEGLPFMQGSAEFGEHHPTPEKWCSDPKKIAEPGDLLLSVRAPVGDTNFANQRIAVGRGLSVIRANSKSLNEFIRFVIQLNVTEMIASSGSGMFASITGKNLREFKVLLPPLPEQKRIVDLVSSIDDVIEQDRLAFTEAKNLRSGLLSDLLSGEHEIPPSYDKVMGAA
jgi:type I restriction enzyme S subunit